MRIAGTVFSPEAPLWTVFATLCTLVHARCPGVSAAPWVHQSSSSCCCLSGAQTHQTLAPATWLQPTPVVSPAGCAGDAHAAPPAVPGASPAAQLLPALVRPHSHDQLSSGPADRAERRCPQSTSCCAWGATSSTAAASTPGWTRATPSPRLRRRCWVSPVGCSDSALAGRLCSVHAPCMLRAWTGRLACCQAACFAYCGRS